MRYLFLIACIGQMLFSGSCTSFSIDSSEDDTWPLGAKTAAWRTLRICSVTAERSGEWSALEKEIYDLLPLLFSEHGIAVVSHSDRADYFAVVKVREREYVDGWETRRSLSVEVRLWDREDTFEQPLPLSAGRSLVHGKQSLASSGTLSDMLRIAVKNAVSALPSPAPGVSGFSPDVPGAPAVTACFPEAER